MHQVAAFRQRPPGAVVGTWLGPTLAGTPLALFAGLVWVVAPVLEAVLPLEPRDPAAPFRILVGPSNLVSLVESFPPYWRSTMVNTWFPFVGDPSKPDERKDMEARSPLFQLAYATSSCACCA